MATLTMMLLLGEMIMLLLLMQKRIKEWYMLFSIPLQENTFILIIMVTGVIAKKTCSLT